MEPNGLAVFETRERVIGHPRSVFSDAARGHAYFRPAAMPWALELSQETRIIS